MEAVKTVSEEEALELSGLSLSKEIEKIYKGWFCVGIAYGKKNTLYVYHAEKLPNIPQTWDNIEVKTIQMMQPFVDTILNGE